VVNRSSAFSLLLGVLLAAGTAHAESTRLKDLVRVRGVRPNYVNGFGLVIGLRGTGDSKKSLTTNKMIAHMLTRMGMKTSEKEVVAGNMAAVMVTGELPAFAKIGDTFDLKVSAIGDSRNLSGGTLVLTPLSAGNSAVFAVAQGAVVVGQASGAGPQVLSVARVPQGATVEREFKPVIAAAGKLTLSLKNADFTTASRIAQEINQNLKGFFADATDVASVEVVVPPTFQNHLVEFIAELEAMQVEADQKAVVVINERTGTVVMGASVVIAAVAIAHGDLSIKIAAKGGAGKKGGKSLVQLGDATVGDLIASLNALGVKPADLVGILQAIHAAGALSADLKFI
jgi:flagellar P-ring protein precursor FlgI